MKKKFTTLLIICLTITAGINFVSAEEKSEESLKMINSTIEEDVKNESKRIGENVTTPDTGYLNISFNDSYNGYCINKGWKGASSGDTFTVKNTSAAVNNNTGKEIGNYLKILFVDFHDIVTRDEKLAQNVIWSFSNDYFDHKYTNYINKIIEIANAGRVIKDHGETIIINNTTKATFDFEVLSSKGSGYQNFFGYKITYSDIIPDELLGAVENTTNITEIEEINSNNTQKNTTNNETNLLNNTSEDILNQKSENDKVLNSTSNKDNKDTNGNITDENNTITNKIGLKNHITGFPTVLLLLVILIVGYIAISKFKKD